jgi:hypothetical protein
MVSVGSRWSLLLVSDVWLLSLRCWSLSDGVDVVVVLVGLGYWSWSWLMFLVFVVLVGLCSCCMSRMS